MTESYDGEIESIEMLVKNRFGGKVYHNGHNRWHFALPHITKNNNQIFWSLTGPRNNTESESASRE